MQRLQCQRSYNNNERPKTAPIGRDIPGGGGIFRDLTKVFFRTARYVCTIGGNVTTRGHPTDRFGKLSFRKA